MVLEKRKEVLVVSQTWPGIEFAGAWGTSHFIDALEATRRQTRNRIERQLAREAMSTEVEYIGRGDYGLSFQVDAKGSGTAETVPNYSIILEACGMKLLTTAVGNIVTNGSNTVVELHVGDKLTAAGGTKVAYVTKRTAVGSSTVPVVLVTGSVGNTETWTSANLNVTAFVTAGASPFTQNLARAWQPITKVLMSVNKTAAAFVGGTPAAGEVLTFYKTLAGVPIEVEGQGIFVSLATDTITFEWLWGIASADGVIASLATSKTAIIHGTPAISWVQGRYLSARPMRAGLARNMMAIQGNATLRCVAGESGRITFDLMGLPSSHSDVAFTGGTIPSLVPPRWVSGWANVDGFSIPFKSFEFSFGNNLVMRASPQGVEGDICCMIAGREPRLTFQLEDTGKGGYDWYTKWKNATPVRCGIQIGSAAGNSLSLLIPQGQVDTIDEDDADGLAANSVTLIPRATTAAGDDEFYLTHN